MPEETPVQILIAMINSAVDDETVWNTLLNTELGSDDDVEDVARAMDSRRPQLVARARKRVAEQLQQQIAKGAP